MQNDCYEKSDSIFWISEKCVSVFSQLHIHIKFQKQPSKFSGWLCWEIFLKIFQNGPIHKDITIKMIFADFFIFSPAVGHPGWTVKKFRMIFS